jgi:hypothetical protein
MFVNLYQTGRHHITNDSNFIFAVAKNYLFLSTRGYCQMISYSLMKCVAYIYTIFSNGARAPSVPEPSRIHDHTQTHHTRYDSSGWVIRLKQRPLPDNTQHSQQTDIHAPGGIPIQNPSKRTAADTRLRTRGHFDRHLHTMRPLNYVLFNYG